MASPSRIYRRIRRDEYPRYVVGQILLYLLIWWALHDPNQQCATFTGASVACDELAAARHFNSEVMPTMQSRHYSDVRRAMTRHGLSGKRWHVGHAIPDRSKQRAHEAEDFGHNLLAQAAVDNRRLGHRTISCDEATFLGATHVPCARP